MAPGGACVTVQLIDHNNYRCVDTYTGYANGIIRRTYAMCFTTREYSDCEGRCGGGRDTQTAAAVTFNAKCMLHGETCGTW